MQQIISRVNFFFVKTVFELWNWLDPYSFPNIYMDKVGKTQNTHFNLRNQINEKKNLENYWKYIACTTQKWCTHPQVMKTNKTKSRRYKRMCVCVPHSVYEAQVPDTSSYAISYVITYSRNTYTCWQGCVKHLNKARFFAKE